MSTEKREVTLSVTKRKVEEPEPQPQVQPGECSNWYIKVQGGHYYTCRICHTSGPTGFPYEECVQLPD